MSLIADMMKKKGMKPALGIDVGKGPKSSSGMKSADDMGDEEDGKDLDVSDDEMEAFDKFQNADTDEEKAMALKAFIKLCGY